MVQYLVGVNVFNCRNSWTTTGVRGALHQWVESACAEQRLCRSQQWATEQIQHLCVNALHFHSSNVLCSVKCTISRENCRTKDLEVTSIGGLKSHSFFCFRNSVNTCKQAFKCEGHLKRPTQGKDLKTNSYYETFSRCCNVEELNK